ncbi:MAG: glutaredoxin 3 [Caulobacterales bacterium]
MSASTSEIVIYTRPGCGYCTSAVALLRRKGAAFEEIGAGDPGTRQEMIQRSGRTTYPQIFIRGQHVGGCDDLYALESAGKLDALLTAA